MLGSHRFFGGAPFHFPNRTTNPLPQFSLFHMLRHLHPRIFAATITDYAGVQVSIAPGGTLKFPISYLYASWKGHYDPLSRQRLLKSINLSPPRLASAPRIDAGDLILEWASPNLESATTMAAPLLPEGGHGNAPASAALSISPRASPIAVPNVPRGLVSAKYFL